MSRNCQVKLLDFRLARPVRVVPLRTMCGEMLQYGFQFGDCPYSWRVVIIKRTHDEGPRKKYTEIFDASKITLEPLSRVLNRTLGSEVKVE